MQTLANLRLFAELRMNGNFEDMGRILENDNRRAGLELERMEKARKKMEKMKKTNEELMEKKARLENEIEMRRIRDETIRVANEEARRVRIERQLALREAVQLARQIRLARQERRRLMFGGTSVENLRQLELARANKIKTSRTFMVETRREDGEKECGICYNSRLCVLNYRCIHSFCKECLINWAKLCPECRAKEV